MSTQYDVYSSQILDLCATLVVKDENTAEQINTYTERYGASIGLKVDRTAPETWRYYMNMAGVYHPLDRMMKVISSDTRQTIEFTKENLVYHAKTRREYRYGTRFYRELLEAYPDQELLIDGILNPIDINAAIAARDHSILYYDPLLVEDREKTLIPQLQDWLDGAFRRLPNDDYQITDNLFLQAKLAVIFMAMPKAIENIRLHSCKTPYAASYHIRSYLASFGPLDAFYDQMTEHQRLFFYRDIRYINRRNGRQDTFQNLTQNVLTHRYLPLAGYDIQHNEENLLEDLDAVTQFERKELTHIGSALGLNIKDTAAILSMENPLARDNLQEEEDALEYVQYRMRTGLDSTLKTKVLESNVLDMKDAEPFTVTDILANHWIYFAATGRYRTVIDVIFPDSGDTVKLSAKDALILYIYLWAKRSLIDLTEIPELRAMRVRREVLPDYNELRNITTTRFTHEAYILEALANNVELGDYVSVESFVDACYSIHRRMKRHYDLYAYRSHYKTYAEVQQMTDRFYNDISVDLGAGIPYSTWLESKGLNVDHFSQDQCDVVTSAILSSITGQDLVVTQSLQDIHKSMIQIMSQLSSYSLQYVREINEGSIKILGWPHLRGGDSMVRGKHLIRLAQQYPTVIRLRAIGKRLWKHGLNTHKLLSVKTMRSHLFAFRLSSYVKISGKNTFLKQVPISPVRASILRENQIDLSTILTGQVIDIYNPIPDRPIADLFQGDQTNEYRPI